MKVYKNQKGRSFVAIMIMVAIAALLLRVAIEQIIKINISYNEATASSTLKLISTALENYAKDHLGVFPADIAALVQDNPPYLNEDYLAKSPIKGYNYSCSRLEQTGYNCTAMPANCMLTGKLAYTVTTGGLFVNEPCRRKEKD